MKKLMPLFAAAFCAFIAFTLCFLTLLGKVQEAIHFSGVSAELFVFSITFAMGVIGVIWMHQERKQLKADRKFRAFTYNNFSDIEVQADRWEEEQRLRQYFNK